MVQNYLKEGKYTDGLRDEYCLFGDIINGKVPDRANEEEFVISSSHGIALSDVALGHLILQKAEKENVGVILPLMREIDILR